MKLKRRIYASSMVDYKGYTLEVPPDVVYMKLFKLEDPTVFNLVAVDSEDNGFLIATFTDVTETEFNDSTEYYSEPSVVEVKEPVKDS